MAELFVAGLIAAFGYYSAQRSTARPRKAYPDLLDVHKDTEHDKPSDKIAEYARRAEQRWHAARAPQVTGVITPDTRPSDMMPFFRSGKAMNTNTQYKQRKLEMFTGEPNSSTKVWNNKKEVESMFPTVPQGVVTSDGTVGNPQGGNDLQEARVVRNRNHHGVGPTETIRVGPGLGVGPEVQATGGFHQFYRQLPQNVNEYRLNTLPGGVNHGASAVSKRTAPVTHTISNPDALVWTLDDRPLERSQAAVLARSADAEQPRAYVNKQINCTERMGIVSMGTRGGSAPVARTFDKVRAPANAREFVPPPMNLTGSHAGVGGYTGYSRDVDLIPTQREQSVFHLPGVLSGAGPGALRPMSTPGPNYRELAASSGRYLAPPTGPRAERMDVVSKHGVKPTKREAQHRGRTNPAGRMNVFDPGHAGEGRVKRARPTYAAVERAHAKAPVETALGEVGARGRGGPKADPVNRRLNFNIAKDQLCGNPLNHDVSKAKTVWGGEPLPQLHIADPSLT